MEYRYTENLKKLLSYYEENINLDKVREARKLNHDSICYMPVDHIPMSIRVEPDYDKWPLIDREIACCDPSAMLYNELLFSFGSIMTSLEIGDDFLYQVRSNHGVIIIPSLFGAKHKIVNNMPWSNPYSDPEELYKIADKGTPDLSSGLGKTVMETYEYFNFILKQYPKCFQSIAITQPDMQGPFDNADLLLGTNIFYELYDNPERIHGLLNVISDTYVNFAKEIEKYLTGQIEGDSQICHGSLFPGHCIIKDDTAAVNLSAEFYEEFSAQYNHKVLERLNGGTLHHCGKGQKWHYSKFRCPYLKGLNFGQPQFHDLKEKLGYITPDSLALIGWGNDLSSDILKSFYEIMPSTGMSISISAPSVDEAKRIYNRHLELSHKK